MADDRELPHRDADIIEVEQLLARYAVGHDA